VITVKTGVPGSGKTLSMVGELLANSKLANPRPVYTNIEGLAIPHIPMRNWEPILGPRVDGVLYTIDWRQCPTESIIVIDEAFLYGYDGKSSQAAVPDYIRDLAVHRKDYSVDIWFIAQHPKLLHQALRRQVGRHQHYRRLFGMGRAVTYEWDMCEDNLGNTKTAVKSNFAYPRDVFKAYKSAQVHTKPKFKLPWWVWLPVAIVPAAVWAFPSAYTTLSSAMTGKGVNGKIGVVAQSPQIGQNLTVANVVPLPPKVTSSEPNMPLTSSASSVPSIDPARLEYAGCILVDTRCGCFDAGGKKVVVAPDVCIVSAGVTGTPKAVIAEEGHPAFEQSADAMAFAKEATKRFRLSDRQITQLSLIK
jgi:zona occludens toxin